MDAPPQHLSSNELVRLLARSERRRVMAALLLGSVTDQEVMAATGLSRREVTTALISLEQAGLVTSDRDGGHFLLEAAFERAVRSEAPPPPPSEHEHEPAAVAAVLDQCFRQGRLVHLPTKRSKRLIVLDRLAQEFEPGHHYTERQVNATLVAFDPDVAALRRYLVDEGFLDRADGQYWRAGGTV